MPKLKIFKNKHRSSTAASGDRSTTQASEEFSLQLERLYQDSPLLKKRPLSQVAVLDRDEVHTSNHDKGLPVGGYYHAYAVSRICLKERHDPQAQINDDTARQNLADTSAQQEQGHFSIKYLSKKTLKKLQAVDRKLVQQAKTNLLVEANYLAKFQHPHICRLQGSSITPRLSVNVNADLCFLITPRIAETLESRLEQWQSEDPSKHAVDPKCPSFATKLDYARQILSALEYLHERQIVMLGLCPTSIGFLAETDQLQLCDLGTCRELTAFLADSSSNMNNNEPENDDDGSIRLDDDEIGDGERFTTAKTIAAAKDGLYIPLLETGAIPRYLAPEVVTQGAGAVTFEADVYSWAMICVEMITLHKPFANYKAGQFMLKICMEGKRPNLSMYPQLPQSLDSVLRRCWRQNEEKRWSSTQAREGIQKIMEKHIDHNPCDQTMDTGVLQLPELTRSNSLPDPPGVDKVDTDIERLTQSSSAMGGSSAVRKSRRRRPSVKGYSEMAVPSSPKHSSVLRTGSFKKRLTDMIVGGEKVSRKSRLTRRKSGDKAMFSTAVTATFERGSALQISGTLDTSGSSRQDKDNPQIQQPKLLRGESGDRGGVPGTISARRADKAEDSGAPIQVITLDNSSSSHQNDPPTKRRNGSTKKSKLPRQRSGDRAATAVADGAAVQTATTLDSSSSSHQNTDDHPTKRLSDSSKKPKLRRRKSGDKVAQAAAAARKGVEDGVGSPRNVALDNSSSSHQNQTDQQTERPSDTQKPKLRRRKSGDRVAQAAAAAKKAATPVQESAGSEEVEKMNSSITSVHSDDRPPPSTLGATEMEVGAELLPSPPANNPVKRTGRGLKKREDRAELGDSAKKSSKGMRKLRSGALERDKKKQQMRRSSDSSAPSPEKGGEDAPTAVAPSPSTDNKGSPEKSDPTEGAVEAANWSPRKLRPTRPRITRSDTLDKKGDRRRSIGVEITDLELESSQPYEAPLRELEKHKNIEELGVSNIEPVMDDNETYASATDIEESDKPAEARPTVRRTNSLLAFKRRSDKLKQDASETSIDRKKTHQRPSVRRTKSLRALGNKTNKWIKAHL